MTPPIAQETLHTNQSAETTTEDTLLQLKKQVAEKYIENLKKKSGLLTKGIVGKGDRLKKYLVSDGREVWLQVLGSFLTSLDRQTFNLDGQQLNIREYLVKLKEKINNSNESALHQQLEWWAHENIQTSPTPTPTRRESPATPSAPVVPAEWLMEREIKRKEYTYPLPGQQINSPIGARIIDGLTQTHKWIDIAAAQWTSILSIADGEIESVWYGNSVQWFLGFGNYMVVKLSNGFRVLQGHMSKPACKADGTEWKKNEKIKKWDQVGLVGNSWKSDGPHLHLEIREGRFDDTTKFFDRKYLDPIEILPVTKSMVKSTVLNRVDPTHLMV